MRLERWLLSGTRVSAAHAGLLLLLLCMSLIWPSRKIRGTTCLRNTCWSAHLSVTARAVLWITLSRRWHLVTECPSSRLSHIRRWIPSTGNPRPQASAPPTGRCSTPDTQSGTNTPELQRPISKTFLLAHLLPLWFTPTLPSWTTRVVSSRAPAPAPRTTCSTTPSLSSAMTLVGTGLLRTPGEQTGESQVTCTLRTPTTADSRISCISSQRGRLGRLAHHLSSQLCCFSSAFWHCDCHAIIIYISVANHYECFAIGFRHELLQQERPHEA